MKFVQVGHAACQSGPNMMCQMTSSIRLQNSAATETGRGEHASRRRCLAMGVSWAMLSG
jgi:hypothetical protein